MALVPFKRSGRTGNPKGTARKPKVPQKVTGQPTKYPSAPAVDGRLRGHDGGTRSSGVK